LYTGAVAVTVANAAIAADVALLRDIPRGSAVVSGSVDSLEVAMVGGETPLEALTRALDVHYALEEAESDKVKYESRAAGFAESLTEALDAAQVGEISKLLLLGADCVGPNSHAAVVGRPFRPMVVGVKIGPRQRQVYYVNDQGDNVRPHACCVVDDDFLSTLSKVAEAGGSFTHRDGSRIGKLQDSHVDIVLVPIDFPIRHSLTIKSENAAEMRKEARYLFTTYVDALLGSDVSFDNEELRRHHAVYKLQDWTRNSSKYNPWLMPGPPTEPYPPGFGES